MFFLEKHSLVLFLSCGLIHRLVQWDVNNEQLHGDFFENKTGDPWYTENIFREVAAADSGVKLFFNEYDIVNYGQRTDVSLR